MQRGLVWQTRRSCKMDMSVWRPNLDDVERISWGKAAKRRGTGSRGVPHRLNPDERRLYDMGRRKGFVETAGSGWRKERRAAPLINTFRNWCDAKGVPLICLQKDKEGIDSLVIDLSPLRVPASFHQIAKQIAEQEPGATIEAIEHQSESPAQDGVNEEDHRLQEAFVTEPIYRLPMFVVSWREERSAAKQRAARLAESFNAREAEGKGIGSSLERGAPSVKAGKSRRSGGFGIG